MATIEIRNRRDDVHAQVKDHPELWGCGSAELAAIGDLVKTHTYSFGFTIEKIAKFRKMENIMIGIDIMANDTTYEIKIEKL